MTTKLKIRKTSLLAGVFLLIFLLSLIPVIAASFYSHPALDDYGFSAGVRQVLHSGGGLGDMLSAAAKGVKNHYFSWQGTFAAIFLFAFQPGVFSDDLYFLTTFIMLGALTGSTFFLMNSIVVKWLKQPKSHMLLLTFVTLFLQIQFVPSISEAFFWFNGSSYYTLFYSFALCFTALMLRIFLTEKPSRRRLLTLICCLLAFIIGGGNYTTGLSVICGLFFAICLCALKKDPRWKNLLLIFLPMIVAMGISMVAPGNAVRASNFEPNGAVKAVLLSFFHAFQFLGEWITLEVIMGLLFLSPLVYMAAEKCSWTFRYPLLVIALTFCIYTCQITPPLFAMDSIGSGRQVNLYYYSLLLMLLYDLFYLSGWLSRTYPQLLPMQQFRQLISRHFLPILLIVVVLFCAGCYSYDIEKTTTGASIAALTNGSAQEYDAIVSDNIQKMEASSGACYVRNVWNVPRIFMSQDFSEDHTNWVNGQQARYFGCESVNLIP